MGTTSSVRSAPGPKPGPKQKADKHSIDNQRVRDRERASTIENLVNSNPELKEDFQLIDEFIQITSSDPNLDNTDYNSKLDPLDFINDDDSDRRILGDYMALVGAAEALNTAYGHSLASIGAKCMSSITLEMAEGELVKIRKLDLLRSVVWNNTDASLAMAERVCETGMLNYFIEDLKTLTVEAVAESDNRQMNEDFEAAISILQNCSRSPAARQRLRELDTVSQLLPYIKIESEEGKLQTLFTLANLVDETENNLLLVDDSGLFKVLFKILTRALKDSDHRYSGFSVEELLHGMTGLAKNDTNKEVLVQKGAVPILMKVLEDGQEEEKQQAVKCIWELAFLKKNKHAFCENKNLLQLLKDLRSCPHKDTAKAAERALWVIKMDQMISSASEVIAKPVAGLPVKHVMISYQWADQKLILQIRDALRDNGYSVWMDIDNMEGSTLQAMAEAVQNSVVVLVCMSERYKLSQNCRSEAEYAFSLEKKIVPLLMERGYKPDGWLGIIKGAKLFFDFSGKYSFEQKLDDLWRELGDKGKQVQHAETTDDIDGDGPVVASVPKPVFASRGSDLVTWTGKDVQNWLTKNGLPNQSQLRELKGDNLVFLRDLSRRAPEFYFGFLRDDLKLKSLDDLMKFSRAVDKL